MKEHKKHRFLRLASLLAACVMLFCTVGCDFDFTIGVDTSPEGTLAETIGRDDTTLPNPDSTNPSGTQDSEHTIAPPDSTGDETTVDPGTLPTYIDPLTGLRVTTDVTNVRPVSIFFDNVSVAAPQSGISKMDILIETMVEGGITRLVGITNDYLGADGEGTLDVYGPIRSSRPYMIGLSQAFGALMVGAGGSPQGYAMIRDFNLDYLDNERDRYAAQYFFRDVERHKQDGYESSLMITGKGMAKLAGWNSYSLSSNGASAFNFIEENKNMYLAGGAAGHVILKYSLYQTVQLVYSSKTGTYYRYQHGDVPHLDAENGEQLNFKNILILFADTKAIPGDTEGRLDITTTGSGEGFYVSEGRFARIRWSRSGDTAGLVITGAGGEAFTLNRGKTYISIVDSSLKGTPSVELNFKVSN